MAEKPDFDSCLHTISMMMLAFGRVLVPEERDVHKIVELVSEKIGMRPLVERISAPVEGMQDMVLNTERRLQMSTTGPAIELPIKICPKCGKEAFTLQGICRSCADAEVDPETKKPKYSSRWTCDKRDEQGNVIPDSCCGYQEKSPMNVFEWPEMKETLDKLEKSGVHLSMMSKKEMGIKTLTDEGVK